MTSYELTEEFCYKHGYEIVTFPLNVQIKLVGFFLSISSILPLIYAQQKYVYPTTFHCNIKIILIAYFSNATFHASILSFFLAYQSKLVYDMENFCDIFLSKNWYIFGHLLNFYALVVQSLLQIAACIERALATIHAAEYERKNSKIGFSLTLLAVILPAPIIGILYWNESFIDPQISVLATPPSSYRGVNCAFLLFTISAVGCLVTLQYIAFINRQRTSCSRFRLSSHFQLKENLDTTHFITVLMLLQICILTIFAVVTLSLRLMENLFRSKMPLYYTLKSSVFLLPIFFIALPFQTIYMLSKRRRKSKVHCAQLVGLSSKGKQGIENYNNIIYSKW
ncbi:unnamed protein product [Auanema sp. JU1783]|nr:unnamed protein product [Auanema sp. JU1783]